MKSVIYREARGFNGQPGNIICEMEDDVAPRVGDIIELSIKSPGEKKRHVVENVTKEIYAMAERDEQRGAALGQKHFEVDHQQVVWVVGVTRLHERGRFPIDDDDLDILGRAIESTPGCREALANILGDMSGYGRAGVGELVRELVTRLC
jgi:hypothetical protein